MLYYKSLGGIMTFGKEETSPKRMRMYHLRKKSWKLILVSCWRSQTKILVLLACLACRREKQENSAIILSLRPMLSANWLRARARTTWRHHLLCLTYGGSADDMFSIMMCELCESRCDVSLWTWQGYVGWCSSSCCRNERKRKIGKTAV